MKSYSVRTRLFVNDQLNKKTLVIADEQHHFLKNVLRISAGQAVLLFNGRDGEWSATVTATDRKSTTLQVTEQTRPQAKLSPLTLAFAMVKKGPMEFIVQKATELGTTHLQPLITQRTIVQKEKMDRLEAIATEAAEQSHRTCVPQILSPQKLADFIKKLPKDTVLYFADELRNGTAAASTLKSQTNPVILIGPEGGFTGEEREMLQKAPQTRPFHLGPRILKAETAAITALSLYQGLCGDLKD